MPREEIIYSTKGITIYSISKQYTKHSHEEDEMDDMKIINSKEE